MPEDDDPTELECTITGDAPAGVGGEHISADVERRTIHDGTNLLLASSQGHDTFSAFADRGLGAHVGTFAITDGYGIDSVQESDGAAVVTVPLGSRFPHGLCVTHDGDDANAADREATNFKLVRWERGGRRARVPAPARPGDPPRRGDRARAVPGYTATRRSYPIQEGLLVSDLTLLQGSRFVALERDNLQGAAAVHKRGFVLDLDHAGPDGRLVKAPGRGPAGPRRSVADLAARSPGRHRPGGPVRHALRDDRGRPAARPRSARDRQRHELRVPGTQPRATATSSSSGPRSWGRTTGS